MFLLLAEAAEEPFIGWQGETYRPLQPGQQQADQVHSQQLASQQRAGSHCKHGCSICGRGTARHVALTCQRSSLFAVPSDLNVLHLPGLLAAAWFAVGPLALLTLSSADALLLPWVHCRKESDGETTAAPLTVSAVRLRSSGLGNTAVLALNRTSIRAYSLWQAVATISSSIHHQRNTALASFGAAQQWRLNHNLATAAAAAILAAPLIPSQLQQQQQLACSSRAAVLLFFLYTLTLK